MTWDGESTLMEYTEMKPVEPYRTKYFSETGCRIIDEIQSYGYRVILIREFFAAVSVVPSGVIYVADPEILGRVEQKDVVFFSLSAINRAKRISRYYRKMSRNPDWLEKWRKSHNNAIPNTDEIRWPELLIHELAHVIVMSKRFRDGRMVLEQETMLNNMLDAKRFDTDSFKAIKSMINTFSHGRDFRRTYRSLCMKYAVVPDRKYAWRD